MSAAHRARAALERAAHDRRLTAALSLAIVGGLVALALSKLDLASLGRSLAHVRGGWLALALALMSSSFMARSESWWVAVHVAMPDLKIDRPTVRRALLIGLAGSAVAPGRIGEAARAWIVARRSPHPGPAFVVVIGTVLLQTILNAVALVLLTGVALSGANAIRTGALALTGAALAATIVALALAPRVLRHATARPAGRVARAGDWLLAQVVRARSGLAVLRHPPAALHAAGFQLSAWGLQLATCWVVLQALGISARAPVAAAAAVLVAVNITAVVPLTPSNVGVFQAACIAALAPFGVHATLALAYGLVLQGVEIACDLLFGIPSLLREGVSFGELRRGVREGAHSDLTV